MTSTDRNERGFGQVELMAAAVIILVIGLVATYISRNRQDTNPATTSATHRTASKNSDLDSYLTAAETANDQSVKDLAASINDLDDQSTLTAIPE